jgi:phosphomethylpyrimidine synthase
MTSDDQAKYELPLQGASHPSTQRSGTNPGSFAQKAQIGAALTFSSPDTPGMPAASAKTAWDFNPEPRPLEDCVTQLESARLGIITPEMKRVAEREPHLTPEQVRDEIAAGRMIIPANVHHLKHKLDPMCIGRASKTKVNANMGASPVSAAAPTKRSRSSSGPSAGAATPSWTSPPAATSTPDAQAIIDNSTVPIGTVPIYSMIIGKKIEDLDEQTSSRPSSTRPSRASTT